MKKYQSELEDFLLSHGIEYILGFNLPGWFFMLISIWTGILMLAFVSVMVGNYAATLVAGFLGGLFLPTGFLIMSNQSDNDGMLLDIKNIFQMLKIQIHAGVYIVDALENCCTDLKSKRLKKELNRLVSEIYMSKDVNVALDDFNNKFCNNHIDILVIILKQSMESGYSISNLDSAFEQVIDVEKSINVKLENSVERNVQVIQVMFMAGIIAIAMYCSIIEFKSLFEIF